MVQQQLHTASRERWGQFHGQPLVVWLYRVHHNGIHFEALVVDMFFKRPARKGLVGIGYATDSAEAAITAAIADIHMLI